MVLYVDLDGGPSLQGRPLPLLVGVVEQKALIHGFKHNGVVAALGLSQLCNGSGMGSLQKLSFLSGCSTISAQWEVKDKWSQPHHTNVTVGGNMGEYR